MFQCLSMSNLFASLLASYYLPDLVKYPVVAQTRFCPLSIKHNIVKVLKKKKVCGHLSSIPVITRWLYVVIVNNTVQH